MSLMSCDDAPMKLSRLREQAEAAARQCKQRRECSHMVNWPCQRDHLEREESQMDRSLSLIDIVTMRFSPDERLTCGRNAHTRNTNVMSYSACSARVRVRRYSYLAEAAQHLGRFARVGGEPEVQLRHLGAVHAAGVLD